MDNSEEGNQKREYVATVVGGRDNNDEGGRDAQEGAPGVAAEEGGRERRQMVKDMAQVAS